MHAHISSLVMVIHQGKYLFRVDWLVVFGPKTVVLVGGVNQFLPMSQIMLGSSLTFYFRTFRCRYGRKVLSTAGAPDWNPGEEKRGRERERKELQRWRRTEHDALLPTFSAPPRDLHNALTWCALPLSWAPSPPPVLPGSIAGTSFWVLHRPHGCRADQAFCDLPTLILLPSAALGPPEF